MGACCSGKENKKGENQEEEIYTKTSRINSFGENIGNQAKPTFELEIENSALSKNLFFIIKKIVNEEAYREEIKLSKFSLEFLWNVYRFYFDDHSDSSYLIYDYRENSLRQENFLKKFKAVNYKIEQMRNFSNTQFQRFRKYIKDKSIIIIAKEDSIITIEEFIYFVLENKLNARIFLFDYNLTAKNNLTELNKNFLEILDYPNFYKMPFIFLSLRFFPHLKNESLVFLDFVNTDDLGSKAENSGADNTAGKFTDRKRNLLLSERKYSEEDFYDAKILNFFKFFKIGASLKLNLGENNNNNNNNPNKNNNFNNKINSNINYPNNNNNNTKSAISNTANTSNRFRNHNIKTRCIRDGGKNSSSISNSQNTHHFANSPMYNFNLKFFELNNLNDLADLNKNKEILIDYIEMIRMELQGNRSVIIQVPYDMDKELLIAILLYFVYKITDIDPINLTSYLRETLFYIPGLKIFSEEKFEKIFKFLEANFGLPNKIDNNILLKSSNSFYQAVNSKSFKSNKAGNASYSASNLTNKENEYIGNSNNNFVNSGQVNRFAFGEGHKKKLSSGQYGGPAYGNNFMFNNNYEEKSEEEKEKIRQEIKALHDKFSASIQNMRKEVTKKEDIVNIISTLEKIIGNILDNIENFKYRTIKCESNTFKKYIEVNTNAIDILKLFGFKFIENKNEKFYVFEESVNIEFLKNSREELFNLKNQLLRNQI